MVPGLLSQKFWKFSKVALSQKLICYFFDFRSVSVPEHKNHYLPVNLSFSLSVLTGSDRLEKREPEDLSLSVWNSFCVCFCWYLNYHKSCCWQLGFCNNAVTWIRKGFFSDSSLLLVMFSFSPLRWAKIHDHWHFLAIRPRQISGSEATTAAGKQHRFQKFPCQCPCQSGYGAKNNLLCFCLSCHQRWEDHLLLEPASSVLLFSGSRIGRQGNVHYSGSDDQSFQQTWQCYPRYFPHFFGKFLCFGDFIGGHKNCLKFMSTRGLFHPQRQSWSVERPSKEAFLWPQQSWFELILNWTTAINY